MSRTAMRVAKLEAATASKNSTDVVWHTVFAKPDMTADAHLAELVARGRAQLGDNVIVIQFVETGPSGPAQVYLPDFEEVQSWR